MGKGRIVLSTEEKIERKKSELEQLLEKKEATINSFNEKITAVREEINILKQKQEEEKWEAVKTIIQESGKSVEEIIALLENQE